MSKSELREEVEKHHKEAYGWALRCCERQREEAEDVLQTVYLKILRGKARFNGASSFRTWLFAVIRKTAADRRRSWLQRLGLGQNPLPRSAVLSPHDAACRIEREAFLETALAELTSRQREVLHLVFYQGMTLEGASEVMGISVGSARTHYERGKAKLRKLLNEVWK